MAGPLASLYIKLGLDATEVEKGANKARDALGGITKGNVLRAAGVAITGGLAIATKGALAMEDAAARFRAETGASAEEAEHFKQKLNALSGSSLVPLEQLDASMTKIRTDLGLVGAEADAAIDQFAAFERATGQGADAVSAFDDILDAYGLTAADTQKVMDTLLVSHQRFGGNIADQQASLAKISGVVQAYGGDWEDANKILNLANATGIEGTEMLRGLSTAVKKFPPGTTFDEMYQSLVDIEDPTERATKAIEVFGAKAGPKLAAAIDNGTRSLDQFALTTEDVEGATTKAADALDDTWGNKIRKAINTANSLLTGFAMNVGPMLTGAMSGISLLGSLGLDKAAMSKLAAPLRAGLTRVLAKVGMEGVGARLAGMLSKGLAMKLGGALAAVGIGLIIGEAIAGPAVREATEAATAKVSAAVGGMVTDEALDEARAKLVQAQKDIGGAMFGLGSVIDFGTRDALRQQIDAIDAKKAAFKDAAEGVVAAGADGLKDGAVEARRAANGVSKAFGALDLVDLSVDAKGVKRSTAEIRQAMISGLGGAVQAAESGMQAIQTALAKPPKLISMKKRLAMFGKAARTAWKNMKAAVKANDPVNAAYWEQQYLNVRGEQKKLRGTTTKTMAEIEADMKAAGVSIPRNVRKGVKDAKTSVRSLGEMDATTWGRHLGETFAAGLTASTPAARTAAFGIAGAVAGGLKFSAPPKHGPLSTIRSWGPHMIEQWAKGTEGALGRAEGTAMAWAKAATPSMGTRWQPAAAYAGSARARGAMGGLRRGGEGDLHVHVGTLIADDSGINNLGRRIDNARRVRRRDRRVQDSPNGRGR